MTQGKIANTRDPELKEQISKLNGNSFRLSQMALKEERYQDEVFDEIDNESFYDWSGYDQ